MIRSITTFLGAGLAPVAPGTFGSLAALPAAWAIIHFGGALAIGLAAMVVFFIGWWATAKHTAKSDDHDPSEIVIDEVAGQWIALLPFAAGIGFGGLGTASTVGAYLVAFLLFRLFDILKPFPVSWADNMHNPLGVMLDDILAGILAALVFIGIAMVLTNGTTAL